MGMPLLSKKFYQNLFSKCSMRRLLLLLLGLIFGLVLLSYAHSRFQEATYLWQATELAKWLRPVTRTTCESPAPVVVAGTDRMPGELKVAMVSIYADNDSNWPENLMSKVILNRVEYCKKHGYDFINANTFIDHTKPVAWSKLIAVEQLLPNYDYIIYMDMDVVIMNSAITVQSLIASAPPNADFLMTNDWSGKHPHPLCRIPH